jgi:hypothetical protein
VFAMSPSPALRRAVWRVVAGATAAAMFSIHCAKQSVPPTGVSGGGGTPASIAVAPASDTVSISGTRQFTAIGRDAAGNPVAITPTWSVASGEGTITPAGMFTAAASPGTATIRATSGSVSGSATIVVKAATPPPPGPVATIAVTPNPASVAVTGTQQFAAAGKDAQGNMVAITPTWSVTSGSGTITTSGLFTAGSAPGTATVKATSGSVSGTATVTVTGGAVATIVISPSNETILTFTTLQLTAVGKDARGNAVPFTPTWSVSGGGTIDGSGRFTAGGSPGISTISAAQGDVAATTTVVVSGTRLVFLYGPGQTPFGSRIISTLDQPGACNAADTHVLPITVKAVDQAGHLVPNGAVTLKLGSNPGGATLSGTLTESQNDPTPSYVTFHEVRISAMGNGYTLIASSPGMVSATSNPFDVLPSPNSPAVRLFFDRVVCTSGDRGNVWQVGTPHTIEVTAVDDAWSLDHDGMFQGNVVTTYSGPVTISVESGGGLGGTLTVSAVSGRATFSDLVPRATGSYVIIASAPGLILHKWAFQVTP